MNRICLLPQNKYNKLKILIFITRLLNKILFTLLSTLFFIKKLIKKSKIFYYNYKFKLLKT